MANDRTRMLSEVRRAILDGDWQPGDRLQPMQLAERFATSTTVVREALALLVGDGLVLARPNRGFFVPELRLRDLEDITELRCVSEALAATLATERGDIAWESDLTAAHHRLSKTPRRLSDDPARINPEWSSAHREFHRVLISACGSDAILRLAANLADSTELYRRWAAPSTAAVSRDVEAEHEALLRAALARDGQLLGALLRSHYESTVRVVLEAGLVDGAGGAAGRVE
ncbi:GntR family transcriptional regulator [Lysinimonas soli]|uniref:GntR family transcriptional regulator n=1 Tax=Lysinimonas soli TaxID=1074233 RepID=A0ABW0NSI7_9MICO